MYVKNTYILYMHTYIYILNIHTYIHSYLVYKNQIIIYIKFCNSFFSIYGYFSILEVVVSDSIILSLGVSPSKCLNLGPGDRKIWIGVLAPPLTSSVSLANYSDFRFVICKINENYNSIIASYK